MKILTHFAHESYQAELAKMLDVEFYHVVDPTNIWPKEKQPKFVWPKETFQPDNIKGINLLDANPKDFDLILVHWHPFIETFSEWWGEDLHLIFLEHTWPYQNMQSEILNWKNIRHKYCDHTVFITPSSKGAWDATHDSQASFIYHSIDINSYPRKDDYTSQQVVTTTNEFISRDWACGFSLWANVLGISSKPYFEDIALYGYGNSNIGGFAKGPLDRPEILDMLCNAGVYFNPSIMSPVPMSLLEAAAVGTPIVSTAYCEPGTIFKNEEHGIISNDIVTLRKGIEKILEDPENAKRMADNARSVVKELFDPARFRTEWKEVFHNVKSRRLKNGKRKSIC